MELSARKQAVLSAIVKAYIETGEPIGSKILTGLIENAPSSATLRNEMNELCSLGLLSQPHTSAGRIPTSLGYRLYISSLMNPSLIANDAKEYINKLFSISKSEIQNIPVTAAEALSVLTGYPAISSYIVGEDVFLKQVQLLPIGRRTAVMFTVFSDGRTSNRICHLDFDITNDIMTQFMSLTNQRLNKKPLCDFNKALLQSIIASSGINSLSLMPLLTNLFEAASDAAESKIKISGASALYNFCTDNETRKILSLFERSEAIINVLDADGNDSGFIFGNDTGLSELKDKVLIVSRYTCNGKPCGKIGIIGPDRMAYEQIIPSTRYTAERLSKLISQAVNDMED